MFIEQYRKLKRFSYIYQSQNNENISVEVSYNRKVSRQVTFYSLDAIIAVGYRVNSKEATEYDA